MMYFSKSRLLTIFLFLPGFLFLLSDAADAQQTRWLNAGSMHNWYSEIHSEREHGLRASQQFGLRWPAIFQYQDAQAYKGWWLGVGSFDDGERDPFTPRVIHAGPRVTGEDYFEATEFKLVSRISQPEVLVDGFPSFLEAVEPDEVDPDLPSDIMISNTIQTALGITVERNIYQFSQEHHDNYHIMEYTYTNETGQYRDIPEQTLEDAVFYHIFRYAPVRKTRYMVGNASGWGINTMIDRVGDGLDGEMGDPMRAQFAWHGYFPGRDVDYDNIGAPMIQPNVAAGYMSEADTTGRLGAYHFVGSATIHADESADNPTDDPEQPSTRSDIHSDHPMTSGNDPFNRADMQREYNVMTEGIRSRHAWRVESDGDFANQRSEPALGTSGGFSATKGYGPYTLEPGESVRIVWVEGVSGISVEKAEEIGRAYKGYVEDDDDRARAETVDGDVATIDDYEKNRWVLTGRDSLLHTFERAIANYENELEIPRPPDPPQLFQVNSGGDAIFLDWDYDGDLSEVSHFEIYRAVSRFDSTYHKVHRAEPEERSYSDPDPIRGRDYYYYITAVGFEEDNPGDVMTPDGALRSSRYYTQSYDPARLRRAAGEAMDQIAIAPNPYVRTTETDLSITDRDEVAFFDVPGRADIRIYTELGEHIRTIEHRDGSGDAFWNLRTEAQQLVASGVYLVVIDNLDTGEQITKKLVVVL